MSTKAFHVVPVLLLIACGGGAESESDAGMHGDSGDPDAHQPVDAPDAFPPDAFTPDAYDPFCHYDCFRYYRCLDGVVDEIVQAPVPCDAWTGECPHRPAFGVECERGCREGANAETASGVCEENVPKDEGDPCSSDEECLPGREVPDGFGGTTELALTCALTTHTCVRVSTELCNGVDDDGDGAVDEECGCSPRVIAEGEAGVIVRGAAFGPDRVAILQGYESDVRLVLLAASGAHLGTRTGMPPEWGLARTSDGFAVLRHQLPPDAVFVFGDDGSTRTVTLAGSVTTRGAVFTAFEDDWLVVGVGDTGPTGTTLGLQLHDGSTGARSAVATITPEGYGGLRFVQRGSEMLIFQGYIGTRIETFGVDSALSVREIGEPSPERTGLLQAPVSFDGRIVAAVYDEHDQALAALDASDEWTSYPLETSSTTLPALAASDSHLFVSWVDTTHVLRTVVLDTTFTRVGESSVPVGGGDAGVWAGQTSAGPRVVVGTDDHWRVVAPCDSL